MYCILSDMGVSFEENVVDPYYATEKFIKMPLDGIKGVANSELFGLREKYVQIIVDTDKVETYNVNLYQLMQKLLRDNFAMSHGYVYLGQKKYMLRSKSRFTTLEDIRNIEIGNGVKLKYIADVVYDFDEEIRSMMRVDGKIAAGLVFYNKSQQQNSIDQISHPSIHEHGVGFHRKFAQTHFPTRAAALSPAAAGHAGPAHARVGSV